MEMKVVVIGGANIDISAKCSYKMIPKDSNIGIVDFGLGGVGRNIAEGLSLFGAEVSLLTAVGSDSFGRVVIDNADEQGIKLLEEPFAESKTGVFAYIADSDGTFVTGVNDMKIISKITPEIIKKHINSLYFTDYVVFEANLSEATISEICSYDFKFIADCASTVKCERLKPVLNRLMLLKANLNEARTLTKKTSLNHVIKELVKKGLKKGIITLGGDGASLFSSENNKIKFYKMANLPNDNLIDTCGCGDAELSGFMIALMRGRSDSDSLFF